MCYSSTPDKGKRKGAIGQLYLEKVYEGAIGELKALFQISDQDAMFAFDPNIMDRENDQSALSIAIKNKDLTMCKLLLDHKVH